MFPETQERWCKREGLKRRRLVSRMPGPGFEPGRGCPQEILRGFSPSKTSTPHRDMLPGSRVKTRGVAGVMVQTVVQSRRFGNAQPPA
jgi:hypothetical protein